LLRQPTDQLILYLIIALLLRSWRQGTFNSKNIKNTTGNVALVASDREHCVFCSIIEGQIPIAEVYQDANFLVLMDKYPINIGHTLVIPKLHYDNLLLMPHAEVGRLYSLVAIIAESVVTAVNGDGFNVGQNNGIAANQIVPHVHVHIIPRFKFDSPDGKWPNRRVGSFQELLETAQKIRSRINSSRIERIMSELAPMHPAREEML
jgi:histidine triad (HIT) family protein